MSKIINRYRYFCITENAYCYVWSDSEPTKCANNESDTIDTTTITIVDAIESNSVNIVQELVPTGGNYRAESKKCILDGTATQNFDLSWKYPISVINIDLISGNNNGDDIVNVYIGPNNTIGVLTNNLAINDTVLYVNSSVTTYINIGYIVSISGTHLGECIAIDKTNGTITIDTPSTINVNSGNYIQMIVNNIKQFLLKSNTNYLLGRKTIGTSSLPANTIVRINYTNTSLTAKEFVFTIEYLY